jgi:hypothetical protein
MIRRRRRPREIPFSLDSFLDVVANVVGIIIRLILIAWVGARSYSSIVPSKKPAAPAAPGAKLSLPGIQDPLEGELAQRRRELDQARERLLRQLRELPPLEEQQEAVGHELAALKSQRESLLKQQSAVGPTPTREKTALDIVPSLAELEERGKRLREAITAVEKLPPAKKVLRYRAPVSRPVLGEELHFECRAGRVSYIDFPGFHTEIQAAIHDRLDELRHSGRIEGVTRQSGPFRVHYVFERNPYGGEGRVEHECLVEPLTDPRGEPAEVALAQGSEFRHLIDGLDARQTVVTFWVYPDSFALFRRLRDYLYDRDVEVAARPMTGQAPIGESSRGTKSRGQ